MSWPTGVRAKRTARGCQGKLQPPTSCHEDVGDRNFPGENFYYWQFSKTLLSKIFACDHVAHSDKIFSSLLRLVSVSIN